MSNAYFFRDGFVNAISQNQNPYPPNVINPMYPPNVMNPHPNPNMVMNPQNPHVFFNQQMYQQSAMQNHHMYHQPQMMNPQNPQAFFNPQMFHPSPITPGSAGSASAQSSQSVEVPEYSTQPPSQVEVDSDEEAPTHPKSSSKWTVAEDDLLSSGWLNTSLDSIKGKGQKEDAFWARVYKYMVNNSNTRLSRTKDTIKRRWSRINMEVCKFVGSYNEVNRLPVSGEKPDDVIARAQANFFDKHGHNFTLVHVWSILRHEPKWLSTNKPPKQSAPTSESGSGSKRSRDTAEVGEEHDSPVRPIGRDAAKRQRGKGVARKLSCDDAEAVAAREAELRTTMEQANIIRMRQLDIEQAKNS